MDGKTADGGGDRSLAGTGAVQMVQEVLAAAADDDDLICA